MNSFILKGNICHTPSSGVLETHENSFLVCIDNKAAGIFPSIPAEYAALPVHDYGDSLIIPGLVDLHIHAPQFTYRGTGMDMELMDWLSEQAFPEESRFSDPDYADKAYDIFANALRKSATSRACIFATRHSGATELLMKKMESSGLITYVGKVNMDREAPDALREKNAEASADDTVTWLENINGRFKRCFPILTPRFIPSCTDELLDRLKEIQENYSLPLQSHLSENRSEIEFVRSLRPDAEFYGQAYENSGLFGKAGKYKTIMAHCVWSDADELSLMKKNGVYIAHCPASNTNLSSGIASIRKYISLGINVGLGSDVAGGHSESMFRAVSDAVQMSKLYWRLVDPQLSPLTFAEAFYLATKGGGSFFGKVGSFEPGFEMDALVLDDSILPAPRKLSLAHRLERAVYLNLDLGGIRGKYVAGQKIVLD